jgi:hypothetical protein
MREKVARGGDRRNPTFERVSSSFPPTLPSSLPNSTQLTPDRMSTLPPTASKLSHLSTTILTSVLELQRLHQLNLPASPSLLTTITKNLSQLIKGIDQLDETQEKNGNGGKDSEVLVGLKQQEERIINLVNGLGVKGFEKSHRKSSSRGGGKTGKLVDTGEEGEEEEEEEENNVDPFESGSVIFSLSFNPLCQSLKLIYMNVI